MQISNKQFCFWDAKSPEDTYLLIIHSAAAFVILVISAYRLFRFWRLYGGSADPYLKTCTEMHILIALWSLTYLIQTVYSISIFFYDLNPPSPDSNISQYSKIFVILDKLPAFLIQTIYIQICIFNYNGLFRTIPAKQLKLNHKFFKTYIYWINYIRILSRGLGLLSLLIFQSEQQIWTTSTINVALQIADSILACGILIYSMKQFVNKAINQNVMRKPVKKQIKRQYAAMITTEIIGVLVKITFLVYFPYLTARVDTSCMQPYSDHLDFFIGHNIIGILIIYTMPITWFLKMYNYKGVKSQINQTQQSVGSHIHQPLINSSEKDQKIRMFNN